jgi:hypothetical protein
LNEPYEITGSRWKNHDGAATPKCELTGNDQVAPSAFKPGLIAAMAAAAGWSLPAAYAKQQSLSQTVAKSPKVCKTKNDGLSLRTGFTPDAASNSDATTTVAINTTVIVKFLWIAPRGARSREPMSVVLADSDIHINLPSI